MDKKKQLEEDMSKEFKKAPEQPAKPMNADVETPAEKKGSNWWKWALGIVIVGGAAAAAQGGKGGGSSGSSGGTVVSTW